jgi:protein-arginine kinase activator protein McsA
MLTKQKILVYKKPLLCQSCGTEFHAFAQAPDEGFGYAAQLYECKKCHAVFSHSLEDAQYLGSPEKKIVGKACPVCETELEDCLEKISFIGVCPECGKKNYKGTDRSEEAYIEAYQLYR